jgi:hypothetical protein
MGRGCIGPRITERSEASLFAGDGGERVQQVPRRARQPVQARDHQHVAGPKGGDCLPKLCSVFAPLATSRKTFSDPAAFRAATCAATL